MGEAATRESNNGRREMVFSESARDSFAARRVEWGVERNIRFVEVSLSVFPTPVKYGYGLYLCVRLDGQSDCMTVYI